LRDRFVSSTNVSGQTDFISSSLVTISLHQDEEELEGLGSERDGLGLVKQQLFCRIDPERTELVELFADLSFAGRH